MTVANTVPQHTSSLSYEILLQKCGGQLTPAKLDTSSTVDPDSASTTETLSLSPTSTTDTSETTHSSDSTPQPSRWVPSKGDVKLLRNVSTSSQNQDEQLVHLLASTQALSLQTFDEDCLQDITKRSGWRLSLLATPDCSLLCGFIVTRITPSGTLVIKKLAVPCELRGCGFGKLIMEEVTKFAKQQRDLYDMRLSSLATAVTFYQRLGFKALTGMKLELDPEITYTEGQVYMEKKLRPRTRRK